MNKFTFLLYWFIRIGGGEERGRTQTYLLMQISDISPFRFFLGHSWCIFRKRILGHALIKEHDIPDEKEFRCIRTKRVYCKDICDVTGFEAFFKQKFSYRN